MGRHKLSKPESWCDCPTCGHSNDVTKQVVIIETNNNHGNDYAGTNCKNCSCYFTVVVSYMGVRCLETLTRESYLTHKHINK